MWWFPGAGVQRGGGFTAAQSPARRDRAERGGGGARVAVAAAGWRGETQGRVGVRLKEVAEDLGVRAWRWRSTEIAGMTARGGSGYQATILRDPGSVGELLEGEGVGRADRWVTGPGWSMEQRRGERG